MMDEGEIRRCETVENGRRSISRKPCFRNGKDIYIMVMNKFLDESWLVKMRSDKRNAADIELGKVQDGSGGGTRIKLDVSSKNEKKRKEVVQE